MKTKEQIQQEAIEQKKRQKEAIQQELQNNSSFAKTRKQLQVLLSVWVGTHFIDKLFLLFQPKLGGYYIIYVIAILMVMLFFIGLSLAVVNRGLKWVGIFPLISGFNIIMTLGIQIVELGFFPVTFYILLALVMGVYNFIFGCILLLGPKTKAYCNRIKEMTKEPKPL